MKKTRLLISLLILAPLGVTGWHIFKKIRHAKRLTIGVEKFKLLNFSLSPVSNIVLSLGNFSPSTFTISQIKVDAYTENGQVLAAQAAPLAQSFTLQPNQNSTLPLSYTISAQVVISALQGIGGLSSVAANFLTTGKYGLPIVLKGFVEAESISIPIEETLII